MITPNHLNINYNKNGLLHLTNEEIDFLHNEGVKRGLFPSRNNPFIMNQNKVGQTYKYLADLFNIGYYT